MSGDASAEAADRMGNDRPPRQLPETEGVHHRHMGAEIAAPAHPDRRENGDLVAADESLGQKSGDEADGRADGSERGERKGDRLAVLETEQGIDDE